GSDGLRKTGAGTLTLSGNNSYSGGTTVTAGRLRADSADAFVDHSAYTVNGGTLDLNGHDLAMTELAGTGGSVALGSADLTVYQSADTTYAGDISGSGSVSKKGAGTLILDGDSSSFAGHTDVQAGSLI